MYIKKTVKTCFKKEEKKKFKMPDVHDSRAAWLMLGTYIFEGLSNSNVHYSNSNGKVNSSKSLIDGLDGCPDGWCMDVGNMSV